MFGSIKRGVRRAFQAARPSLRVLKKSVECTRARVAYRVGQRTPIRRSRDRIFSGVRAFAHLQAQCAFGPRAPGTPAHERAKGYILEQLAPLVDKLETQNFSFKNAERDNLLQLSNIIASFNDDARKKVLLSTHWDTRPTADCELKAKNRATPIIGANDGASGTGVLLELARVFHEQRPAIGVVLHFSDGEDWGSSQETMFLGARHFTQSVDCRAFAYAIVVDMVGDKNLRIFKEAKSQTRYPDLNKKVWDSAVSLGYGAYFAGAVQWRVFDDHDVFHEAGIPAILLIDFNYAYWHTLQDTPGKCSARSLQVVGDVLTKIVGEEAEEPSLA